MDDITVDDYGRPEPPLEADEAGTLLGFLDYQRATLEWKCRGLNDQQLRIARPPSTLSLGGIMKHMAYVEDYWFTEVVAGHPTPEPWASADFRADPDWELTSAAADVGSDIKSLWMERVDRSKAVVQVELEDDPAVALAATHSAWGGRGHVSLRWVLVHMIEEYARHNGHADLLRESIDGEIGE